MAGRRGNGEGTVYQLPDGRWRGQATIAGKRAGVYGATRKEAQTKLRQLIGDADRGLLPPTERLTLAQHIERWLEDVVKRTRRPRTLENYRDMALYYAELSSGSIDHDRAGRYAPRIETCRARMSDVLVSRRAPGGLAA